MLKEKYLGKKRAGNTIEDTATIITKIINSVIAIAFLNILLSFTGCESKETFTVEPNEFFCPLGQVTDKEILISTSEPQVFKQKLNKWDIVINVLNKPEIELIAEMLELIRENNIKKQGSGEISIPKNACYIESKPIDDKFQRLIYEEEALNQLPMELFQIDTKVYAWNEIYTVNGEQKYLKIKFVMMLNKNIVSGEIIKKDDSLEQIISVAKELD